jgi:hypothetical protein
MPVKEPEIEQLRTTILRDTLQACMTEYSDLQSNFTHLDTKAQSTTAIAGILLAAALAFAKNDTLKVIVELAGRWVAALLAAIVLSLMGSTALCLYAMRIRDTACVDSEPLKREADAILSRESSEWTERHVNFLRGQIADFQLIQHNLFAVNERKAKAVSWGQLFLSLAIVLVAMLLLTDIATAWRS